MQVSLGDRLAGMLHARLPGLGPRLASLETRVLSDELLTISIREPIYVTGFARAGSTLQLELLNAHPDTASHRYADYRRLSQAGLAARYSGDPKSALDYFVRAGKASREAWQGFYNEACLHAVEGRPMEALQRLRNAIEREPGVASIARTDGDLASIRALPEFAQLLASVEDPGNRPAAKPVPRTRAAGA